MNWLHVADVVRCAQCFERQRCHSCNCRSGKGLKAYNPCTVSEGIAQVAESLDEGNAKGTPAQVEDWLYKHTCQASRAGRTCQHKGCMAREGAIDFIQGMRKAA